MRSLIKVFLLVLVAVFLFSGQTFAVNTETYEFVEMWGKPEGKPGSGEKEFNSPNGIAVDIDNYVYVSDSNNFRILRFHPNGKFKDKWQSKLVKVGGLDFKTLRGIAIDPVTKQVYVSDVRDSKNHRILKINLQGDLLAQWGKYGKGESEFNLPSGIAVDSVNKLIYVCDTGNNRIQVFSSDGEYKNQWGEPGSGAGKFNQPFGIAVNPVNKLIYVCDTGNNRIQVFYPSGEYVDQWAKPGLFKKPRGLAIDANGNVYVADMYNYRILKLSGGGVPIFTWGTFGKNDSQFKEHSAIAVDSAGNVYVADSGNNRIQKFKLEEAAKR